LATWGNGLFALTDDERMEEIVNQPVRGLAPDGRGGALAIVGAHSLCRRKSKGEWVTVATSEFELSCCMAVGDTIYVGTDDARMLRLNGGVLNPIESFNNVAGRESWFAGSAIVNGQRLGPPLGIRSVAANCDGSVLFANVHVGGIPRSTDGGRTWQPTIDINSDVHEVRAHLTDPDTVVAASAIGLCLSRDGGATWTIDSKGLHALHCSAVALLGDEIFVSASTDPFAAQGGIYRRSVKADAALTAVDGGLPLWMEGIVDTGCMAASGSSIAVIDRGGNVYGSGDFGGRWSCWATGLPTASGVLLC
jgi:hypothetical protein